MKITSSAFADKGKIPSKYTCDGEDVNPPLAFEDVPEEAQSLALLVEDPDSVGKTWLHWAVFNINPATKYVNEDSVPGHGSEVVTDFGNTSYGGPCPANGIHRYNFKLFALADELDITEDATLDEIYSLMDGNIIEKAEISALYSRE
jgi:Raf kinase inhibitor-like YbhB/YbcL family protein